MPGTRSLDDFRRDGHLALRGAFAGDAAAAMSTAIWRHLEAHTPVRRDDRGTWPREWLAVSFKRLKRHSSFRAVLAAPAVRATLDGIFGPDGWSPSRNGAQILCTFPSTDAGPDGDPDAWRVPSHLWHMDGPFQDGVDPPRAVKLFSVVEPLAAHGGATCVLAGSPTLQAAYATTLPVERRGGSTPVWTRFLRDASPWTAELVLDRGEPDRNARLLRPTEIAGRRIEVRTLDGAPGDVHVTHINTFHSASTNVADRPRIVVTHVVTPRADAGLRA